MKYRIKTTKYLNGKQEFSAQVKTFLGWRYIMWDANTTTVYLYENTREETLKKIDLHYAGRNIKLSIVFEYINKS